MATTYDLTALRNWYKEFTKALYEKANIDVTRVEDLGRVRNFRVDNWVPERPTEPDVDFRFAFMDPNTPSYPEPGSEGYTFEGYSQWLMDNLNPQVDDAKIQQLYEMSHAGTLMIFAPGTGVHTMQQIRTDEFGNITVSLPLDADFQSLPEDQRPPLDPSYDDIKEVPNPEDFNLSGFPVKPVMPENTAPGFWSWLGYLLGMDTDYAKMVRFQEEAPTYELRMQEWIDSLNDDHAGVSEYKTALHEREVYLQQFEEFRSHPLNLAISIDNGYRSTMHLLDNRFKDTGLNPYNTREQKLLDFLDNQHKDLPQGKILKALNDHREVMRYPKKVNTVVSDLVGHDPQPSSLRETIGIQMFDPAIYQPKRYELPKPEGFAQLPQPVRKEHGRKWRALADIAGFAALADPDVAGDPPRPGFTKEETAQLNYTHILDDLITGWRSNASAQVRFLDPAREKAQEAIYAYYNGDPSKLGKLLAQSIQQTNREIACLNKITGAHTVNTLHLFNRMMETLNSDPELLKAANLSEETMKEAQANVAYYQILRRGQEAKEALLQHALYQKDLSPEQLKNAARDVLFANTVSSTIIGQSDAWADARNETPEFLAVLEEYMRTNNTYELEADAQRAREANAPDADQKQQLFEKTNAEHALATGKMNLSDLSRPASPMTLQLLDEGWIANALQTMDEKSSLNSITSMSREEIGRIFSSDTTPTTVFGPPANSLSQVKANHLTHQKEMGDIAPSNEMNNSQILI